MGRKSVEDYKQLFRSGKALGSRQSEDRLLAGVQRKILEDGMKAIIPDLTERLTRQLVAQFIEQNKNNIQQWVEASIKHHLRQPKDGKDGLKGERGKDGRPGKDGKDGLPGRPGKDGKDGKTPEKGVDYFSMEDIEEFALKAAKLVDVEVDLNAEEIVKEINKLEITPDKQIDWKHIKNAPGSDKREGAALHRGGVKLIWNTELEGAINSSNTVFTLPTASPTPKDSKYLVSARGAVKDEDNGDFTISADNRTVTFDTAPPTGSARPRIPIYEAK